MTILSRTAVRRTAVLFTALAALTCAAGPAPAATAGPPRLGAQYVRLAHPQPVPDPSRREVLEFFWYGCEHSQLLEGPLEKWAARRPSDVVLRRVPAVWPGDRTMTGQARLYYTLDRLGLVDRLQKAAFRAVRDQHRSLADERSAASWAAEQGIDPDAFRGAYESSEVARETAEAPGLLDRYQIPELPSLVVQGRYRTAPTMTGGVSGLLPVIDHLLRRVAGHHKTVVTMKP